MTHLEYENICSDVNKGRNLDVTNEKKHESGRILMCSREYFNVKVGEGWQVWSREECEQAR